LLRVVSEVSAGRSKEKPDKSSAFFWYFLLTEAKAPKITNARRLSHFHAKEKYGLSPERFKWRRI
jgi:hypothetical protein